MMVKIDKLVKMAEQITANMDFTEDKQMFADGAGLSATLLLGLENLRELEA